MITGRENKQGPNRVRNQSSLSGRDQSGKVTLSRKPQHEIMQEMTEDIAKHNRRTNKELNQISKHVTSLSKYTKANTITNERVHDRLESMLYEQRVTNILLAKLVTINETVLLDDVKAEVALQSEALRSETYNRVLNGD